MKKLFYLSLIASSILFSGCVMNKLDTTHKIITLKDSEAHSITVDVTAGEQWSSRMKAGPFIFNVLPQMVLWTEDADGKFIETLYITGADFKKMRHAAKNENEAVFFAECLPYWALKMSGGGGSLPSKKNPYPDTVTSATPMADFTLRTSARKGQAAFFVFAEINKSDDKNSSFTKDNNDWAGQPSLIYSAAISANDKGRAVRMKLLGHGGMLGDKPEIYKDLSGFDTALEQIRTIDVTVE